SVKAPSLPPAPAPVVKPDIRAPAPTVPTGSSPAQQGSSSTPAPQAGSAARSGIGPPAAGTAATSARHAASPPAAARGRTGVLAHIATAGSRRNGHRTVAGSPVRGAFPAATAPAPAVGPAARHLDRSGTTSLLGIE